MTLNLQINKTQYDSFLIIDIATIKSLKNSIEIINLFIVSNYYEK